MQTKKSYLLILILLATTVSLTACINKPYYHQFRTMKKDSYCAYGYIKQLRQNNILVFQDKARALALVRIPSETIFLPKSANFNDSAYKVLDIVVALLNCYEEEDVKVASSIDPLLTAERARGFAVERARQVSNYLWTQEINASLIYGIGKPMPGEYIEIAFKKYWRDTENF